MTEIFLKLKMRFHCSSFTGYDGQEGGNVQATTMNGAEAVMGMSEQGGFPDQGGMKRHKTRLSGRKALLKQMKRKGISKKSELKKNRS